MRNDEFAERITAMMQTLYRVSYTQLASPHDRDEAVQEALCKAWRKRRQLRDERHLQTWVIRILINECHNIQKKRKRELSLDVFAARDIPPDADCELHDALLQLQESLRLPIVLHYIEGFTISEIAGILFLPSGTVKSRMARGRRELKGLLGEEEAVLCEIQTV